MTKTEFKDQFKRLRVAGYRLPISEGVTVDDVMTEWFQTFQGCTVREFSTAIDNLKRVKQDTFWPATGELWSQIKEIRKGNRIRRQTEDTAGSWSMSDEDAQEFLALLRATKDKIIGRMAMPHAEPQTRPQALIDAEELAREDRIANGETA